MYVGDLEIKFKNKILHKVQEADKIFVLLDIPSTKEMNYNDYHNIYCYDFAGNKIWQIGKHPKWDSVVFTMIHMIDSILYANDFAGRRFIVRKKMV